MRILTKSNAKFCKRFFKLTKNRRRKNKENKNKENTFKAVPYY